MLSTFNTNYTITQRVKLTITFIVDFFKTKRMVVITPNPKTQLLLGDGFEVINLENREWLKTIALWKNEVALFGDILRRKAILKNNNPQNEKMSKDIDIIPIVLFEDLENSINEYGKLLSRTGQREKGFSDDDYRERHHYILLKMDACENNIETFKKIVFDYAKHL